MTLPTVTLKKADFDESDWEDVISGCEPKECHCYYRPLWQKSYDYQRLENPRLAKVFLVLGNIASLRLETQSYEPPLDDIHWLDMLEDEEWNVLVEVAPDINDPEMRARIADLLWVERRDFEMAKLAVESYLDSARILEDPVNWLPCLKRIERAVDLWSSLGSTNNPLLPDVIGFIEERLDYYNGEDPEIFSAKLMSLLLNQHQGHPTKYTTLAERAAMNNPGSKCPCQKPARARAYWEVKARWYLLEQDGEQHRAAQILAAETYIEEANGHLVCRPNSYSQAAWYLQLGIEAFRRIGGMQERTDEVYRLFLEYQRKSFEEGTATTTQFVDLSRFVEAAKTLVRGRTLHDAILALASVSLSADVASLRSLVEQMVNRDAFQFHIPLLKKNEEGKVVGLRDSLLIGSEEEKEKALEAEMFRQATFFQDAFARGMVRPAVQQINLEHTVRYVDFHEVVKNNPFVPEGREYIYARGLCAGMAGDYVVAAHLLIPQLEHSLRHLLFQHGVRVTGLDSQGIQDEHLLGSLLERPELEEILGRDVVFNLRGLLKERLGSNLRDLVAHGLLDTSLFFTDRSVYLWWLVLHLCCTPLSKLPECDSGETSGESSEGEMGE